MMNFELRGERENKKGYWPRGNRRLLWDAIDKQILLRAEAIVISRRRGVELQQNCDEVIISMLEH